MRFFVTITLKFVGMKDVKQFSEKKAHCQLKLEGANSYTVSILEIRPIKGCAAVHQWIYRKVTLTKS